MNNFNHLHSFKISNEIVTYYAAVDEVETSLISCNPKVSKTKTRFKTVEKFIEKLFLLQQCNVCHVTYAQVITLPELFLIVLYVKPKFASSLHLGTQSR